MFPPRSNSGTCRTMIALRFVIVTIFLHFFILTKAVGISKISQSSTSDSSDDDESWIEKNFHDLSHGMKNINCSDVESKLARVAKWVLIGTSSPENVPKVRFYFSSRNQPSPVKVKINDEIHLNEMDFKIERRTVFIVHGFMSSGFDVWIHQMREAFLLWEDVNVIVVHWTGRMSDYNYYQAAINTKAVGNTISRFLLKIMNATRIAKSPEQPTWGKLYFVGHSLGAHVSGNVAKNFNELQRDWPIDRITGLDPAELCFRDVHVDFRLDIKDANFVDVIHTSGETETALGFGWEDPLGHVDFYPNGGKMQPGCSERHTSLMKHLRLPKTAVEIGRCNHRRAIHYFIESLISTVAGNCTFFAQPWDPKDPDDTPVKREACDALSWTEMGIRSENYPQRGNFFLSTSESSPYCLPYSGDSNFSLISCLSAALAPSLGVICPQMCNATELVDRTSNR